MNAGPLRVLIADDDPVGSAFLSAALSSLGAECHLVRDGDGALERARRERFDLLLLDLRMPSRSGAQVLQALRSDPAAASSATPAYALSADLGGEQRLALQRAGFVDALQKPVSLAALETIGRGATPARRTAGPDPGSAPASRVLDDEAALAACGSRDVLDGLRELLRGELPLRLGELEDSLAAGRRELAREVVHRLRGACRFAGASELDAALAVLDQALREGRDAQRAAATVVEAAGRLIDALEGPGLSAEG